MQIFALLHRKFLIPGVTHLGHEKFLSGIFLKKRVVIMRTHNCVIPRSIVKCSNGVRLSE